ncbi:MAG TPA: tRNA (adenosine(37)-N6)-threonylcarbamoyltransferase complex dimerization subunit type 1 TsaB [Nitrospirota bacterium]|nr:tRNA (adenosine(37)-N6)-threonylcarbamoyltransferase complex dimerization subunit type 1 TsaB [Nitrospirota bacterium]
MLILGIETSTKTGSVAVVSDDCVIAQYSLNIALTHSERLMATVDRVLRDIRLAIPDLDGFAVSIGPGSFTGLRIGISTVKGLSFATGKPVAAVPTLQALAWNLPFAGYPVCPLLDARKKEVYAAIYKNVDSFPVQTMTETVISLSQLAAWVSGATVFTGEGSHIYRAEIEQIFSKRALFAPRSAMLPSAAAVAEIGLTMLRSGKQADLDALTPKYIRRPEAEVAWERKQRSR